MITVKVDLFPVRRWIDESIRVPKYFFSTTVVIKVFCKINVAELVENKFPSIARLKAIKMQE